MTDISDLFARSMTGNRVGNRISVTAAAAVTSESGKTDEQVHDTIVIGSGPAGYTAAIYLGRDDRDVVVVSGLEAGGQLVNTGVVENYPGFPDGIEGPELMDRMREQARKFGADIRPFDAVRVNVTAHPFTVTTSDGGTLRARSLLIATGSHRRTLNVAGEQEYAGHGVSYCAVCDAAFFKGRTVVVVGGGDTALSDALVLSRVAARVVIIHRRTAFRASQILQDRVKEAANISICRGGVVARIVGDGTSVTGVEVEQAPVAGSPLIGDDHRVISTSGVFVSIGSDPSTAFLSDAVDCDARGYIRVKSPSTATSVPGVFVAGDVADPHYQQAVVAAGMGARAALDITDWLDEGTLA